MSIDPDVDFELLQEAAKDAAKHFDEFLDEVWDSGVFIFPRQKPMQRLAFYQGNTLPGDVFLVTDPGYLKLREAGMAPPLFAEIMAQQYQQAVVQDQMTTMLAAENGMAPPIDAGVLPPPPPQLWVLLLKVPRIFEKAGRDFKSLLNKELDKVLEQEMVL